MNRKLRIVFIVHDSNLTGAPILLYNLVKLLAQKNEYDLSFVLARGGEMEKKFETLAPVCVLKSAGYSQPTSLLKRAMNYLKFRVKEQQCIRKVKGADIIFNNTIANGEIIKKLRRLRIPLVTYVHELGSVMNFFNKDGLANLTLRYSDHLLYPSNAVRDNLINNHSVPQNRLSYLPYFFKDPGVISENIAEKFQQDLFAKKNIPAGKFYVAGMGRASHRKGIDLFLKTCRIASKLSPDVCFVWVGGFEDAAMETHIEKEITRHGLRNFFFITGDLPHSVYNLSPFHLFFLSSREDPYPLVVLEAAILKIPSLYFSDTGGIAEFAGQDAGWEIDRFDVDKAAHQIIKIKNDPVLLKKMGETAFMKAKSMHMNADLVSNKFSTLIHNILKKENAHQTIE